jgi:hypothetical protein
MTETERAYQERPRELRHRVRYEDLVADPADCLAGITDWLGLDRDAAAIASAVEAHTVGSPGQSATGAAATRRSATPGLWRENLSEEESALAHEIMGEKLADLGYEVAPELGAVT